MGWFKKLTGIDTSTALIGAGTLGLASATGGSSLAAGGALGGSGLLSGLVQGAVGLGTDYLDSQMQLQNQKKILGWQLDNNLALADKQLAVNQQLQKQAYDQNLQMWNYENEYNSPVQQMQRLRQAGLNPNLVYGSGNVSGLTTSGAPQMTAAEYNAPTMGRPESPRERTYRRIVDGISTYQQLVNQQLTNDFTRQRIALASREADRADRLADAQIENMSALYGLRGAELGLAQNRFNQDVKEFEHKEFAPKSWLGNVASDFVGRPVRYLHKHAKNAESNSFWSGLKKGMFWWPD